MGAPGELSDFLEYLDPRTVQVFPLPSELYKVKEPWQVLWQANDPEDRYFGFVKLHEGTGAEPASAAQGSQFDFESVVKAGVMKARELSQTQNYRRDTLYIINATRTSFARIILPEG